MHQSQTADPAFNRDTPRRAAILGEYLRPWKLVTFMLGTTALVVGAFHYEAPDWDVGISLVMAILAYLTAPWSLRTLLERRWRMLPYALFFVWFSVDGSYAIYWHFRNPAALALMREANFAASLALYGMCGVVWLYRGTLRQLLEAARAIVRKPPDHHA
jgi:glucan phosphoethanolaminetransferase (alkaline phosphatase superfamily)